MFRRSASIRAPTAFSRHWKKWTGVHHEFSEAGRRQRPRAGSVRCGGDTGRVWRFPVSALQGGAFLSEKRVGDNGQRSAFRVSPHAAEPDPSDGTTGGRGG